MDIIKSDRITLLPILNKNKQLILDTYLNNLFLAKNKISLQSLSDSNFQNLLFSKDKKLLNYYINFSNPIFTSWELQKFFNSDLIDKELNRIERFFKQYNFKLFIFIKQKDNSLKKIRKQSKLGSLIKLLVKNFYFSNFFIDSINSLFNENKFFQKYKERIEQLALNIFNRYKYHRKPIDYTTPSIVKCGQKDLGNTKPRIIKDESNKKYKYWYILDYIDLNDNNKKKYLKLPLAYNEDYHKNLSDYSKSLGKNKFKKNKNNGIRESIINYDKLNSNFKVLFEKEHQISLSKNTNRLTITFQKDKTLNVLSNRVLHLATKLLVVPKVVEHKLVTKELTNKNSLGIDIGGSTINTLVNSLGNFTSFTYLERLVNEIDKIDKLPNRIKEERLYKGKVLAKVLRQNEAQINLIIKDYLDYCDKKKIKHLIFEKLDTWNVKWRKDKTLDEKFNRVFRLLRTQGLVNLFKKQARNRNILVHTIPAFYTSQMCSGCHKIDKNNLKDGRKYICSDCGLNMDRDVNIRINFFYETLVSKSLRTLVV